MFDVTAIGELLIDFGCLKTDDRGYPTLKANAGGAPANLLAALQAYGCKTAFLGKVGNDTFGKLLISTLAQKGVDTTGVVMDPRFFTTLAFVTLDANGNRDFSFARKPGADLQLTFEEIQLSAIEQCRDFHFGTLSLTDEPARSATKKAVQYAKEKGKQISFDPNLRKPLWADENQARTEMIWGLHQADIVKISEDEIDFLWQCTPEQGALKLHEVFGAALVFVTLGGKGCLFSNGKTMGDVEIPRGIQPVDTTGAGDIFGGSMLSRIMQFHKPLQEITSNELYEITRFACCAASLSTQRHGGISSIVGLHEVEARLSGKDSFC